MDTKSPEFPNMVNVSNEAKECSDPKRPASTSNSCVQTSAGQCNQHPSSRENETKCVEVATRDIATNNDKPEAENSGRPEVPLVEATNDGNSEPMVANPEAKVMANNTNATALTGVSIKKNKKKKKRNKTAKRNGTGFEKSFADAPVTPDEFMHEKDILYHPTIPFAERIEECIQRWRAKRRLDSYRANIFTKYLMVGGVESGARQFTGFDRDAIQAGDMDKDEIRTATAIDVVNTGNNKVYYTEGGDWDVDFAAVAAGFFSEQLPEMTGYHDEHTLDGISVVENFLNYVLHHNVCPEYELNIQEARSICRQARSEIFDAPYIRRGLPGQFNTALLGLCNTDNYNKERAEGIVSTAITWGDNDLISGLSGSDKCLSLVESQERRLEVVSVSHAVANILPGDHQYNAAQPLGHLQVRDTFIEDGFSATPTEEDWRSTQSKSLLSKAFTLWVDDALLERIQPGQKLHASIRKTSSGIHILGAVLEVYPTYYTFLPQNLMLGYKQPVDSLRPATTVHTIQKWMSSGDGMSDDGDDIASTA